MANIPSGHHLLSATMTVSKTADVCRRFNIHRNTLFRWEEQGVIPRVQRNLRGEREFSDGDLIAIARFVQMQRHAQRFGRAVRASDAEAREHLSALSEAHSLFKFTDLDDATGLEELKQRQPLQSATILALIDYARTRSSPQNPLFWEVLQTVLDTSGPHSLVRG
jgi:DNA-binding transcriptional MerR regulator